MLCARFARTQHAPLYSPLKRLFFSGAIREIRLFVTKVEYSTKASGSETKQGFDALSAVRIPFYHIRLD